MLIASSNTIEGLTTLINSYWYSTKYSVDPETLQIIHPEKEITGFRVEKKGKRYRFLKEK